MTSPRIVPAALRLVAYFLNQLRYRVPSALSGGYDNMFLSFFFEITSSGSRYKVKLKVIRGHKPVLRVLDVKAGGT
jgi:hypothetical protein